MKEINFKENRKKEIYGSAWEEVDLDVIKSNTKNVANFVHEKNSKTKVLAVVKADGYGHGAVEVARTMEDIVDYFGTATIFESLELRKEGINIPILNFSYIPQKFLEQAVKNNITITTYDYEYAKLIEFYGEKNGVLPKIHIKVDTGMSRLGYLPTDEAANEIEKICSLKLNVEGIFSHFAKADSPEKEATKMQAKRFFDFIKELEFRKLNFEIKHICNSAAMMEFPEYYLDMVRAGGILYGHFCLGHYVEKSPIEVQRALSIRTILSSKKTVDANTGVSYGWLYTTERESIIGAIPIGYVDGISRKNTNNAEFLINGKRVKEVGLMCMDQMMIDITEIDDAKIEDVVTIIGRDGEEEITLEERAKAGATGKCELFAAIGNRLPKVYFKNGEYYKTLNNLLD